LRAEQKNLADLAASVADGVPVDWATVELDQRADPADRRLVSHLRLVENIASLHRSIPTTDDDPALGHPGPLSPRALLGPIRRDRASQPPVPATHWGRLRLLDRIGEGTSCEVYRAWDTALHREVALKLLRDEGCRREARTRLLEEARRLARIRHAHVVQIYGAEEHGDRVGLWMELVRGEALEHIVVARGPFGGREAALIGLDLCTALAAVHGASLLHRDVKAQNVMRESGGRVVLMDFGTGEELAGTNRLVGTPLYLAPEIFRGQPAAVQSDLYSLGVLLFHLLTGKYPVTAASMTALAYAHESRQRQPLRDLRPDLAEGIVRVVEQALDSDPTRRYRSAGDMEAALRESLEATAVSPSSTPRAAEAPRGRVTRPIAAGIAAALLLTTVGVLYQAGALRLSGPGTTTVAPAVSSIASLAVLPLRDQSESPTPNLAEALTDQLINTVGQIGSIRVTSRASVMSFNGAAQSARDIGRALNVDALLESSMVRVPGAGAPDRIRVNARLVLAGSDTVVWTRSFEREFGDILALQSDIARAVADGVRAALTREESARLEQSRRVSPGADEAFLAGRYHLGRYGLASAEEALAAFSDAVRLEPSYAAAFAGAARARFALGFGGRTSHAEARALALADVQRALQLDPNQADAHATLADLRFYYDWDWPGAEREYRQAIALNPSFTYARTQYARYLAAARRGDEARSEIAQATLLDPRSVEAAGTQGLISYYRRDYVAAAQELERALALDPNYARAYFVLGRIREAEGRLEDASAATARAIGSADEAGASWRVQQLRLEALAGRIAEARAGLDALARELASRNVRIDAEQLSYFYLASGDTDGALASLERAVADRQPTVLWMTVDPRLDPLRSMPRFQQIEKRLGLN
jgi:eukaryotic-like serine/threonine-protein kinase